MHLSPSRRAVGIALAAALAAPAAFAQAISDKPLRVILAGPPGGALDIVARLLAEGLQKEFGQPVIVDAKPGAGGSVAVAELLKAPHDGATVLISLDSMVSEIPHILKLRFDMQKDVKPLAELARGGLVLVGNPAVPAKTVAELVTYVKANPGRVSYASYSAGTISHVMGLQMNKKAGIDMTHVAYKGAPPALADVMGGHVQLAFAGIPNALPLVKGGKVVPFAVSLPKRSPILPDVPTFAELGYQQLEAVTWLGMWITPDVPFATQRRLRDATLKVMGQPAMGDRLREMGFEAGQPRTPDELAKSLSADYARIGGVLKSIDFKPE